MKIDKVKAREEYLKGPSFKLVEKYTNVKVTPEMLKTIIKMYPTNKNTKIQVVLNLSYHQLSRIIRSLKKEGLLTKREGFNHSLNNSINEIKS